MVEAGWSSELIYILVSSIVIILILAAIIARNMDRPLEAQIDSLKMKNENLDGQLRDIKQDFMGFKKELSGLREDIDKLTFQKQRLRRVILARKNSRLTHERLVNSQEREIENLHNSILTLVDSINETGLEAIRMELHLARFAIRAGRQQIEEISRLIKEEQSVIAEDELKIKESGLGR